MIGILARAGDTVTKAGAEPGPGAVAPVADRRAALGAVTPKPLPTRGRQGQWGQAAFSSAPAARSISRRLSVLEIERAWAVAATVTSQTLSIGRSSSTWWIAFTGSTMLPPYRRA